MINIPGSGFSMMFNDEGVPKSVKNAAGTDLSGNKSKGFFGDKKFNKMSDLGNGEYKFETSEGPKDSFTVKIEGKKSYVVFRYTSLPNGNLTFHISKGGLNVIALDYMITRLMVSKASITVERLESWERSSANPLGGFALFEGGENLDETLLDIWVDEDLPHPKVEGEWNRKKASAWLDSFADLLSDNSTLYFQPKCLEDHYSVIPFVKTLDARNIYLFPEIWRGEYTLNHRHMDEINPEMYPNGMSDILKLKEEVLSPNNISLSFHSLSGYVGKNDPDFGVNNIHPDIYTWGEMKLTQDLKKSDKSCIVIPQGSKQIPVCRGHWPSPRHFPQDYNVHTFRVGDDWFKATKIVDLKDGTWKLDNIDKGKRSTHSAGESVIGYCTVYNNGFLAHPNKDLLKEIAKSYAIMSNKIGLSNSNFDGYLIPGVTGRFVCHKYAQLVYENLDHPTSTTTSVGAHPPAWLEYEFPRIKKLYGQQMGGQPGVGLFLPHISRASSGLEDAEHLVFRQMAGNGRNFSLGGGPTSLLKGVKLSVLRMHGLSFEIVKSIKCYKQASFNMNKDQRNMMLQSFKVGNRFNGTHKVADSLWSPEGSTLRKWIALETDVYTKFWSLGQEHGTITPRFYLESGKSQELQVANELTEEEAHVRIIGRVLPHFSSDSSKNIDLMQYLKKDPLVLEKQNPNKVGSWGHYLTSFKFKPAIDLSANRGIGVWVTGDSSGASLVIRINSGKGRDYVVPINFKGKRWIEIPNGEQGWRVKNWGWTNQTHKTCGFNKVGEVMIGLGHMPPETNSKVVVEGLTALFEEQETFVKPTITLGNKSVQLSSSIDTENHFTLDPDGKFTVYDPSWNVVFREKVENFFLPLSKTTTFEMKSASSKKLWLEVGVQASNKTCPNPDPNPLIVWSGGKKGSWKESSNWKGSSEPVSKSDVLVKSFTTVTHGKSDFTSLLVDWDSVVNLDNGKFTKGQHLEIVGELNYDGELCIKNSVLNVLGGIGSSVKQLTVSNKSTLSLTDNAKFHNSDMKVNFEGANTLTFTMSSMGFTTISAGDLGRGAPWSDFTFEINMERYKGSKGDKIVLLSFNSHAKIYDKQFTPSKLIHTRGGEADLIFDTKSSSLVVQMLK